MARGKQQKFCGARDRLRGLHALSYASVIRRNAFSPDKALSGEIWRGGARTAARAKNIGFSQVRWR